MGFFMKINRAVAIQTDVDLYRLWYCILRLTIEHAANKAFTVGWMNVQRFFWPEWRDETDNICCCLSFSCFPSIYWSHFCCTPCWARVLQPFCTNHCIGCPNSLKAEWMSQNEGVSFPSRQSIWEVVVTQEKTRKYICFLWKSGKA